LEKLELLLDASAALRLLEARENGAQSFVAFHNLAKSTVRVQK